VKKRAIRYKFAGVSADGATALFRFSMPTGLASAMTAAAISPAAHQVAFVRIRTPPIATVLDALSAPRRLHRNPGRIAACC